MPVDKEKPEKIIPLFKDGSEKKNMCNLPELKTQR